MTMTSLDHVTSSVTWPFESQWAIAYWWSTGTKSVSPAVFEILGHKHIGVTTLTFQGHVRSSITWPFDSQLAISYRCSIGTKSVYPAVFQIMIPKYIWVMTLTFLGHVTSSVTWPFESQYHVTASDHSTRHRLLPIYWRCFVTKPVSSPSQCSTLVRNTVVRATFKVNGKPPILGSCSPLTPWPIDIKFDTDDYVGDTTPHAKNGKNRTRRAGPAKGWNVNVKCGYFLFF